MLKCSHCNKKFKYESERKRHEQSHAPQFECNVCSKKFSFLSALRRHEKQHDRKGNVKCDLCSGKFRDETLLKRHIKYAHKGTFTCTKCNANFSSELALRTHTKTHKPESERRYRCSHEGCKKTFNFPHHLKHHELTHTDVKQHFCNVCGRGFIQSQHYKSHLKTHKPDDWLPCVLSNCKKSFPTEYALRRHITTHRNSATSDSSSDLTSVINIAFKKSSKDNVLCIKCGLMISQRKIFNHTLQCVSKKEAKSVEDHCKVIQSPKEEKSNDVISDNVTKVDSNVSDVPKNIVDGVSSCKSLLGGCIVSGDSEVNSDCICAQISGPVNEFYEVPVIENGNNSHKADKNKWDVNQNNRFFNPLQSKDAKNAQVNSKDIQNPKKKSNYIFSGHVPNIDDKGSGIIKRTVDVDSCKTNECTEISNNYIYSRLNEWCDISITDISDDSIKINKIKCDSNKISRVCDGCECVYNRTLTTTKECQDKSQLEDLPKIEYREDGIVKISDICDIDIVSSANKSTEVNDKIKPETKIKCVPMNSCKDVLGNCIVSGDDTMGEGCLCAKMAADDQEMSAQEIEEITPQPT